jgi:RNA polymerase sigma-70 factor (ECF subfamily)
VSGFIESAADDQTILDLRTAGRLEEALGRLFDVYETRIYRLCLALLREPSWAEDIAQQSLIRIWKGLAGFDGRSALSTWIYAIVRNRCHTALSTRGPRTEGEDALVECADEEGVDPLRMDQAALLRRFVEALPDNYRVPVVLYYYEEESVAAVAERLGCPEGTVKTNLSRARAALKAQLASAGLGEWLSWQ